MRPLPGFCVGARAEEPVVGGERGSEQEPQRQTGAATQDPAEGGPRSELLRDGVHDGPYVFL